MARFLNSENQFVIPNYSGGVHEEVDSSLLKANEAAKAQNCIIDKGVLKSAKGLSTLYSIVNPPKAMMTYYQNGIDHLIMVSNQSIFRLNENNGWDQIWFGVNASADRYDFVNDNIDGKDLLIFSNGYDPVKIYDGTTVRNLKTQGKNSDVNAAGNYSMCKYCLMHYERLWLADDNNLYASSVTRDGIDIEDFTTPSEETEYNQHGFDLSMYGADGKIIGMTVCFDDILIWKERSLHKIFGTSPDNYQKITFAARGGISDKSIAVHETGAYFIDHNGFNWYDGTSVHYISKPIEDTWQTLDVSKLNRAIGFIYNDKYIVAVAEGDSVYNNLIIEYDISTKSFMFRRGFNIEGVVEFNRKACISTTGPDILEYNSGNAMGFAFWETGYTDFGVPEAIKEVDTIYCIASGTGYIKITVTADSRFKEMLVPLSPEGKVYQLNTMISGKVFKIRIENTGYNDFTLRGFKMLYELDYD